MGLERFFLWIIHMLRLWRKRRPQMVIGALVDAHEGKLILQSSFASVPSCQYGGAS